MAYLVYIVELDKNERPYHRTKKRCPTQEAAEKAQKKLMEQTGKFHEIKRSERYHVISHSEQDQDHGWLDDFHQAVIYGTTKLNTPHEDISRRYTFFRIIDQKKQAEVWNARKLATARREKR